MVWSYGKWWTNFRVCALFLLLLLSTLPDSYSLPCYIFFCLCHREKKGFWGKKISWILNRFVALLCFFLDTVCFAYFYAMLQRVLDSYVWHFDKFLLVVAGCFVQILAYVAGLVWHSFIDFVICNRNTLGPMILL